VVVFTVDVVDTVVVVTVVGSVAIATVLRLVSRLVRMIFEVQRAHMVSVPVTV
jgi:hypothetical protein